MVMCEICKKKFKVITQLHLNKHDTTIKEYLKKYSDAIIREPFNCQNCGVEVVGAISARTQYCKTCAVEINRMNVLRNVRKFNRKQKSFREKMVSDANAEFGFILDNPDSNYAKTRVDSTHSGWDYIKGVIDNVGTISDADLEVNEDGRIKGAVKLERQIENIKRNKYKAGSVF